VLNQQDLIEISNAGTRIYAVETMAQRFIAHAAANGTPNNIPAQLQVNRAELAVSWNSITAKAVGRTVRASDGSFRVEYVFRVPVGDENIEVARFYLSDGGKIWADVDEKQPVCDFNNSYLATHVCGRVAVGMLSRLFVPAAHEG
jgi:hypothetical protein